MDQRKRRRLTTRIVAVLVVLGLGAFIAMGFVPQPVPVSVGRVVKRPLEVTIEESGKTRVKARYVVSAPVLAQMTRLSLKVGDRVEQGDVLLQLLPMQSGLLDERTRNESLARVNLAQANVARSRVATKGGEVALSFARDQAERLRTLRAQSGASQQALEQAEFALRAAEEELAAMRSGEQVAKNELSLAQAVVRSMSGTTSKERAIGLQAPVSGSVLRVYQESEGVVQPGTPILELGDPRALEVVVDVLTTDAVQIASGAEATIERWGGDKALRARVRSRDPSAFTTRSALGVEEQRVAMVLDILDPPEAWAALGDGFRVEARIRTQFVPEALAAPAAAVFREGQAWSTFVLRPDSRVKRSVLEIGARTPDWVEVKAGAQVGDRVVVYPSDQVVDGIEVVVSEEKTTK
jgi:HlyD family secretion protein